MKQFLITPAAGKRLIARAIKDQAEVQRTLDSGTVVIMPGPPMDMWQRRS